MAKKTITEYEGAEDTITKIQCENCDTQWDNPRNHFLHRGYVCPDKGYSPLKRRVNR